MKRILFLLIAAALPTSVLADDPSISPVEDPVDPEKYAERYRLIADIDGDENDDLLLSEPIRLFGNMGGLWTVYLKRGENFKEVGTIDAHPKAISIEPDFDRHMKDPDNRVHARVWVYLRAGGGRGTLGYFRISSRSVEDLRSLQIYPGDGGTKLGRAIYAATFTQSPIPYRVEKSETSADGSVMWKELDQ